MQRPRLRDNQGKGPFELYPLGQIPDETIYEIAKWMTYHFAIGKADINGEDWGDIFAKAIGSEQHKFTWQPHGSQFTILYDLPSSVKKFKVKRPPVFDFENMIKEIGFDESWVTIL